MSSISEALITTIRELQELPSLQRFSLGGGTNLALRYNHRQSIDIDLFCPDIIGKEGYEYIVKEIKDLYGENLFGCDYPAGYYPETVGERKSGASMTILGLSFLLLKDSILNNAGSLLALGWGII